MQLTWARTDVDVEKKPPGLQEPPGAPGEQAFSPAKSRLLAPLAFLWRPCGFFSPGGRGLSRAALALDADEAHLSAVRGGERDGVLPGEAGVAEAVGAPAQRLEHPIEREVPERIGRHVPRDLVDRMARGDELAPRRGVDPVVAGP